MINMAGIIATKMPILLQALNYASLMKYAVEMAMISVLKDVSFNCTLDDELSGLCPVENGNQLLSQLNFSSSDFTYDAILVFVFIILYRFIAFIVLKIRKVRYAQ